jgi:putative nucleotidyltransferase with HDIG domain
LAETGVLEHSLPELAAQIGLPQDKIPGDDLWDHSLGTLNAAAILDPTNQRLRLAALLHDIGKPATFADGHFIGHDVEGAKLSEAFLTRLAFPRREIADIAALIGNHMFSYERRWTGAAVRRFIRRVGRERIVDQLNLRRADNVGSGLDPNAGHLAELEARVRRELDTKAPLDLSDLAIDGNDLVDGLAIKPGPIIGLLLERLLGSVIADPSRNTRERLLAEARTWAAREGIISG